MKTVIRLSRHLEPLTRENLLINTRDQDLKSHAIIWKREVVLKPI